MFSRYHTVIRAACLLKPGNPPPPPSPFATERPCLHVVLLRSNTKDMILLPLFLRLHIMLALALAGTAAEPLQFSPAAAEPGRELLHVLLPLLLSSSDGIFVSPACTP